MATQEKLLKSLEILKNLCSSNQISDTSKKKEKIQHCHIVTEAISNSTIKIAPNFDTYLSITIEVLLQLCDDTESDVRMVAEECLNRIIRSMNDGSIGKVRIELHKSIKKNGPCRSLRVALSKFAQLSHLIRPHKGKPYVVNLFPTLSKISERPEEQIHETLAISLPKIMEVLGSFASDKEIKGILKSFFKNVTHQSATIRRTTASCILTVCLNCRKPYVFIVYILDYLLDLLTPLEDIHDNNLILGVMICLKNILPQLQNCRKKQEHRGGFGSRKDADTLLPIEKLLQIYESCLYCLCYNDHNVINGALETLHVLLESSSNELKRILTCPNGIANSRIAGMQSTPLSKVRSPSQLSVATNLTSEDMFPESELTETVRSDIEKWIDESKLSVIDMAYTKAEKASSPTLLDSKSTSIDSVPDFDTFDYNKIVREETRPKSQSIGDNLERLTISDRSSEKSLSYMEDEKLTKFEDICIGTFTDRNVPLIYCSRLIAKTFLLSGQSSTCISDKIVRVSVKSLAMLCLSSIVKIYPEILLLYLDKKYDGSSKNISDQSMSDLLLFKTHPDPQLRGLLRLIVGNFIRIILTLNQEDFSDWIAKKNSPVSDVFNLESLIKILIEGLQDESSNCCKQTLISLSICLERLLESSDNQSVISILNELPSIAKNPYWLIKVTFCDVISKLPYVTIYKILGNNNFQDKIIDNVLLSLLQDEDIRVRNAAAHSIITIIPNLYFPNFKANESPIIAKLTSRENRLLKGICSNEETYDFSEKHLIENRPFPFTEMLNQASRRIQFSLSKIIIKLYRNLLTLNSKYFLFGCVETLSLLSNAYPTTTYSEAWNCLENEIYLADNINSELTTDLLSFSIYLLQYSVISYDLNCHLHLLNLCSNIYAGYALLLLKPVVVDDSSGELWEMFTSKKLADISQNYLSHIIKLLSIFHYVVDELMPVQPQSKAVLATLAAPNNLSPIKRRKSDLDKKVLLSKSIDKDDKTGKDLKSNSLGNFSHLPHYMKLYEILRTAYINYKISLESEACEKFTGLLQKTLNALCILMEVGSIVEFGEIADDILNHFRSTFSLEAAATVDCVQQLLKCLFGTNLAANASQLHRKRNCQNYFDESQIESEEGFYNIFQNSYNSLSSCFNELKNITKIECDDPNTIMGYLHRKDIVKNVTQSRSSDKVLANYIRIFEPMVIKSLKQYTITSDVKLQCKVLQLLNQLIQLRVNYCLLDSEQIFIDFVLKQFEYIEEGQIPLPEQIIPKIFQFLVQLSYSKQHSRSIMHVPKIIQLCDGLMASGQSPITHCVPALSPIVEDIFLTRYTTRFDMKELETTREVVFSNLLKVAEYHQVIDMITLILDDSRYCNGNPEKWIRWSSQTIAVILPLLKENKIRLDSVESIISLKKLIFVLNPQVFDSIDQILLLLFQDPPSEDTLVSYGRWFAKILLIFLALSPQREDQLLSKISELKGSISPGCIFEKAIPTADPLNVLNNTNLFSEISSEIIFVRFLFKTLLLTSSKCCELSKAEEADFLIEQLNTFLMYCLHMFQSGSHCRIANTAIMNKAEIPLEELNQNFLQLASIHPNLTILWCYILTLLNYNDQNYWAIVMNYVNSKAINRQTVAIGGVILFSDYTNEEPLQTDQLYWFLNNYSESLVDLCNETPVLELISSIHRTSTTSKLFLESLIKNCSNIENSIFKTKLLSCIENTHPNHIGILLKLLLPKFLISKQVALSRTVANLASRKIELLLTMPMEDVNQQLSRENVISIAKTLVALKLSKKYEALSSLLNKLCTQYYDISPLEFDQKRSVNSDYIKKLQINRSWYLSQIKSKCKDIDLGRETAELLNHLNYVEIVEFMKSSDFNRANFKDCLRLGTSWIKRDPQKIPPIIAASIDCLLNEVNDICQIFTSNSFNISSFMIMLHNLMEPVSFLINNLSTLSGAEIDSEQLVNIMKFSVISLESANYLISKDRYNFNVNWLSCTINCCQIICKQPQILTILSQDSNLSSLHSLIENLYKLLQFLLKDNEDTLPEISKNVLEKTMENCETKLAGESCYLLSILVTWLYKIKNINVDLPKFLLQPFKGIIISLARLPLVNSYLIIPTGVWKSGWIPELAGNFNTQVPPLPVAFLQEIDILEEFIYRITLLGWTSRQQFEETWMCLLTVLCSISDEGKDSAEMSYVIQASGLAVKAITALLLQTLYQPLPGNTNSSTLIHVSRDPQIQDHNISIKKLRHIHNTIMDKHNEFDYLMKIDNVFNRNNFEKYENNYSYGQLSIKYLLIASKCVETKENCNSSKIWKRRQQMLDDCGLDVNSCLQFLLDFYSQCLKQSSLSFLHEMVRSAVIISDLFNDRAQFSWLLQTFLDLSKCNAIEDEILHQYIIIGICKAGAVLNPDLETYETIKKMIVQYLKSSILSSRIACLYGLLYILEGCILSNISIGGISDEMQLILPCAVEYVQCNLNTTNGVLRRSKDHTMLVWSLAFFLLENIDEIHMQSNFITNTLQTGLNILLNQQPSSSYLNISLMKAFERLLIVKRSVVERVHKQIISLALEKMKSDDPMMSLLGKQLLLTYMYTDCAQYFESLDKSLLQSNPDHLVQTIEKVSAIFEHIKRGCIFDVEILCWVLPDILNDFFSPSDILTKVIGEFLSPQQPHPKLLSRVVFKIFEQAIQRDQLSLLQDWVVFSLSNFTQSLSVGMATWCLICFFISASSNDWLRSIFPYVQTRVGRYEYEDRKLLCIVGADFYNNLTNPKQKETFIENFNKAKNQTDILFNDLLSSL